ncbi:MAG: hypothetical protein FJW23_08960 [Acidimicrobiia bacterium]|nr:hypothetical protein [Acidimicrobiia bacterium]
MKYSRMLACAGVVGLLAGAGVSLDMQPVAAQEIAKQKFLPPVRGEAELGYTKPAVKRTGKEIVTTIMVKNMSTTNTIVGLRVDEFWYDKAGNPVTGDQYRHRQPLMPEEIIEIILRTPVNPAMDRNQYRFEHANGTIKTTLVPKLEPKAQ